jgi:hypothetical protein
MDERTQKRGRPGVVSCRLGLLAGALILAGLCITCFAPHILGRLHWLAIGIAIVLISAAGSFLAVVAIVRRSGVKWALAGLALNVFALGISGVPCLLLFFPAPHAPLYTLPSGKQVRILSVIPAYFPQGPPTLIMTCETDIRIEDMAALRKEVDEIWEIFRKDVESAHMTMAAIRMTHNEEPGLMTVVGLITVGKGYGFVYEKRADGKWYCLDDDKK